MPDGKATCDFASERSETSPVRAPEAGAQPGMQDGRTSCDFASERSETSPVRDAFEPSATIPGYTLGDVYWSGVNPLGSEPLAITAVRRNADGTVELAINACRPDPEAVYHVFRMADLAKPEEAVEVPSAAANFVGDAAAWKTTWRGDAGSSDRAFFFVKAVPVQ